MLKKKKLHPFWTGLFISHSVEQGFQTQISQKLEGVDSCRLVSYLNWQQSVEKTEKNLLVDVHSLQEINGSPGLCQVVIDQI